MNDLSTDDTNTAVPDQIAKYLAFVAHLDMPLSAKIEMISALQFLMENFVNRAFSDDPVQHVHEMRARDEKWIPPVVSSKNPNQKNDKSRLSSAFTPPAAGRRKKERT